MSIDLASDPPVTFEAGPNRSDISKVFGTGVPDPNDPGDILLIGGILNTNNINFGKVQLGDFNDPTSDNGKLSAAGARIARSMERWDSETNTWEYIPDMLDKPRAMNTAVILPTKQLLTINGGKYAEYDQIYEPLLMSPNEAAPGGYTTTPMNPADFPRLYHNSALLLPDARVLVIGGNANRAARESDGTVHTDVVPDSSTYYALAKLTNTPDVADSARVIPENEYSAFLEDYYANPKSYFVEEDLDIPFAPAEVWQAEIFSPPYLFGASPRPELTNETTVLTYRGSGSVTVGNVTSDLEDGSLVLVKLGSITHAFDYGQILADLDFSVTEGQELSFALPDNANLYPPGYYMMFYVNAQGKPSEAKMVQLIKNSSS